MLPLDDSQFDLTVNDLGIKSGMTEIPPRLTKRIHDFRFWPQEAGNVVPIGFDIGDVAMYCVTGTVPLHIDELQANPESITLGLVLYCDGDFCLTDGTACLPLAPGTIYRLNPNLMHGTCLPDGSSTQLGKLCFITSDYHNRCQLQTPMEFLDWIYESVEHHLHSENL